MIFRRDKTGQDGPSADARSPAPDAALVKAPAHPSLSPDELRPAVDPARLGFRTTADLEPISGLIGQDRALKAIELGVNIRQYDFNIFVLGPSSAGKSTAVRAFLAKKAATRSAPMDWVYVNNFDNAMRPRALTLSPSVGCAAGSTAGY